MNEIVNAENQMAVIEGLAMQARTLRMSINTSMWQLARVFVEAKELVPHGEWGKWLAENADVSEKTAQDMMAAYKRFGGKPQFERLGRAKTFKLLPLPEGTEEAFMEEHDVEAMTTREIQEAVKQARAEAQAEAQAQIEAAEARARALEQREPEIQEELLDELRQTRAARDDAQEDARHFADLAQKAARERADMDKQNRELRADLADAEQAIAEQQEAMNRAQEELLNMQSAQARGEAERAPADELTPEMFRAAAREFMGRCARMPYMGGTFATMDQRARNSYSEDLRMLEGFCEQARRALDSFTAEGGIVIE